MARPIKEGLDYFPKDVHFYSNRKIRRLMKEFGAKGVIIYDYLLCVVFKNGYYLKFDNELCFDISDTLGDDIDEDLVYKVIKSCIKYGLISEQLFVEKNIITSKRIQNNFSFAKRNGVIAEEMAVIAEETTTNDAISTQSKVKERKENKTKENNDDLFFKKRLEIFENLDREIYEDLKNNYKIDKPITYIHKTNFPLENHDLVEHLVEAIKDNEWKISLKTRFGERKFKTAMVDYVNLLKTNYEYRTFTSTYDFRRYFSNWFNLNTEKYK